MTDDVQVKFGADASAVGPAAAEVEAEIKGLQAQVAALAASMKAMGASSVAAMHESAEAAKEEIEAIKGVAEAVTEFREMLSGLGEALMAAFAVEEVHEFVEKMGEAAEQALHTAQTFGLTVGEVQKMNAQAALFGVPAEAMSTAMMRIDKSFQAAKEGAANSASAFKEVGINIQGSYTQTQLMNAALEGLGKMEAGPAKVAAAMALFGRNIQAIGPLLGLTESQIEEAGKAIDEYGAVNEDSASKGIALAESMNVGKVASMGLHNVMTDALAPVFKAIVDDLNAVSKAFIDSYNSGGIAKVGMDVLAITIKTVVTGFDSMIMVAKALYDVLKGLGIFIIDFCSAVVRSFANMGGQMGETFGSLGTMIKDALTGHLDQATARHDAYLAYSRVANAQLGDIWSQFGAKAVGDGAQMFDHLTEDAVGYFDRMKTLWGDKGAQSELPEAGTGTTADDASGKKKKAKPKTLGELADEEAARQAAMQREFEQGLATYLADEADGERQKLGLIQDGARQQIAAIRGQIKDVEDAEKEGLISHQEAHDKVVDLILQERSVAIQAAQDIYNTRVQADQAAMQFVETTSAEYRRLKKDEADAAVQYARMKAQADDQANSAIEASNRHTADQVKADWDRTVGANIQRFGDGLLRMAQGTETWQQEINRILGSIEATFARMVERTVSNWLFGETIKTSETKAGTAARTGVEEMAAIKSRMLNFVTNEKQILNDAAGAASATYKSVAAIPVIGWALAPPAAAAAFAAVEGFGNMVSAAGGFDIPSGVNPLVQTHAEEMILPARIANPMRKMLSNFESFQGPGAGAEGAQSSAGDTHVHLHMGAGSDSRSLQTFFDQHAGKMVRSLNREIRGGARLATG